MSYGDASEEAGLPGAGSSTEIPPTRGTSGDEVQAVRDSPLDLEPVSPAARALARAETEVHMGFTKEAIAYALISIAHSLLPPGEREQQAKLTRDSIAGRRNRV